jgi:putative proteasome-type protease
MTFCLGIHVEEGLVGIADTLVTSGSECIRANKATVHHHRGHSFFLMTSGLRSIRDKAVTYFEELLDDNSQHFDRLYKAVNAFAAQLRRVAQEDKDFLEDSNLSFNLHSLIGGQLEADREPRLYLLYPQGNWVEIGEGTPYCIIGETGYGKPILDRTLKHTDSMSFALKVGCLAFDSTRISAANVDFPIDVVLFNRDNAALIVRRYEKQDLVEPNVWWQEHLRALVNQLPSRWMDDLFEALQSTAQDTLRLKPPETG